MKFTILNHFLDRSSERRAIFIFESANEELRTRILASEENIKEITDMINNYAVEHYPVDTPRAFKLFADLLYKFLTYPTYPQDPDDFEFEDMYDQSKAI